MVEIEEARRAKRALLLGSEEYKQRHEVTDGLYTRTKVSFLSSTQTSLHIAMNNDQRPPFVIDGRHKELRVRH